MLDAKLLKPAIFTVNGDSLPGPLIIGTFEKRAPGPVWWGKHRGKTSTHAPGWAFPVSFSVTLSSQSLPRASFCDVACGSVVLLYAARVFDYFVVIEIAFMDN